MVLHSSVKMGNRGKSYSVAGSAGQDSRLGGRDDPIARRAGWRCSHPPPPPSQTQTILRVTRIHAGIYDRPGRISFRCLIVGNDGHGLSRPISAIDRPNRAAFDLRALPRTRPRRMPGCYSRSSHRLSFRNPPRWAGLERRILQLRSVRDP